MFPFEINNLCQEERGMRFTNIFAVILAIAATPAMSQSCTTKADCLKCGGGAHQCAPAVCVAGQCVGPECASPGTACQVRTLVVVISPPRSPDISQLVILHVEEVSYRQGKEQQG